MPDRFFNDLQMDIIFNYIKKLNSRLLSISKTKIRIIVFLFSEEFNLEKFFNWREKLVDDVWIDQYLSTIPYKETYFGGAPDKMEELGFFLNNIYDIQRTMNLDPSDVYCLERLYLPHLIVHEQLDRGQLLCTACADGRFIPPFFVLPPEIMSTQLNNPLPPGSVEVSCTEFRSNLSIFHSYITHFARHSVPLRNKPVILFFDANFNYLITKSLWDYCLENHIILLGLPRLSINIVHPLKLFFSGYFQRILNDLHITSDTNLAENLRLCYSLTATRNLAIDGFINSGIFPFQPVNIIIAVLSNSDRIQEPGPSVST